MRPKAALCALRAADLAAAGLKWAVPGQVWQCGAVLGRVLREEPVNTGVSLENPTLSLQVSLTDHLMRMWKEATCLLAHGRHTHYHVVWCLSLLCLDTWVFTLLKSERLENVNELPQVSWELTFER